MTDNQEKLRFPIGKFSEQPESSKEFSAALERIASIPQKLRLAVENLTDQQLDTPYREGGWTLRQVIHHLPDSHMNAYIRFKLVMTEDNPIVRAYDEKGWAECEEAKNGDINLSLDLLESLHKRMVVFLKTLSPEDLERTYTHPVNKNSPKIKDVAAMYAWHGDHHLAHITTTLERTKW